MELEGFKLALSKRIREAQQNGYREELYRFYCVMQSIKQAGQLIDHVHDSAELLVEAIGEPIIPLLTDTFEKEDLIDHGLMVNPEENDPDLSVMCDQPKPILLLNRPVEDLQLTIPETMKLIICSFSVQYLAIQKGNAVLLQHTRVQMWGEGVLDCKDMSVVESHGNALVNLQDYAGCVARGTTSVYAQHHSMAQLFDNSSFLGTDCARGVILSEGVSGSFFGFSTVGLQVQPRRLAINDNVIVFQDKDRVTIKPQLHNTTYIRNYLFCDARAMKRFLYRTINPVQARYCRMSLDDQKTLCTSVANQIESPQLSNWLRDKIRNSQSEEQLAAVVCQRYTYFHAAGMHPDYLRFLFKEQNLLANGFYMFDHEVVPQFMGPVDYHVFGNNMAYQPLGSDARGHFFEDSVGVIDSNTCFFHEDSVGIGRSDAVLQGDGQACLFGTENNRIEACGQTLVHGYEHAVLTVRQRAMAIIADQAQATVRDQAAVYMVGGSVRAATYEQAVAFTYNSNLVDVRGSRLPEKPEAVKACPRYKEIVARRALPRPRPDIRELAAKTESERIEEAYAAQNANKGLRR